MRFFVVVALLMVGCGIKAPPKPPLEATAAETPDAGCSSCAVNK